MYLYTLKSYFYGSGTLFATSATRNTDFTIVPLIADVGFINNNVVDKKNQ